MSKDTKAADTAPGTPGAPAASGGDEVARLKAQLAEKDVQLAQAERVAHAARARQDAAEAHAGKAAELESIPKERSVRRVTKTDASARRKELMQKTAKKDGFAYYRLGGEKYYRDGVTSPPFSVVRIPAGEEPSYTWELVDSEELLPKRRAAVELDESGAPRPHDRAI